MMEGMGQRSRNGTQGTGGDGRPKTKHEWTRQTEDDRRPARELVPDGAGDATAGLKRQQTLKPATGDELR